ncbi:class I SAM-dependent methyltransferase [Pokkaliibacter sp. CJK22405]|uniref:class I SAM-dependent methyltransferase n=1 Tax=Pokkaliibacter sp. CJK22405 TaxID=3384615 RepID=UPI0039848BD9
MMDLQQLPVFIDILRQALTSLPAEVRRVFHGRGRTYAGLEQITADWLQGQLLITLFSEETPEFVTRLEQQLTTLGQEMNHTILLQHRYQAGAPTQVLTGEVDTAPVVVEEGLRYQLDVGRNQNMGLFLDMRLGRRWMKAHSAGKQVLNLFAYTCGFSVAAIAGGAERVVNLDMARGALTRGRENHRLNGHNLDKVQFLGHELFKSWGKVRKSGPYDLIIIDPPSFQQGSFVLTQDYQKILRRLPELLADQGEVLACVNSPEVSTQFLLDEMQREAPTLTFVERLENPPEFPEEDAERSLKVLHFIHHP